MNQDYKKRVIRIRQVDRKDPKNRKEKKVKDRLKDNEIQPSPSTLLKSHKDHVLMPALSLSDDTPPLPSSRQSNVVLLAEVSGLLPGESLAEVVEVVVIGVGGMPS